MTLAHHTQEGASAPSNVLPFPQTPKALRRRSQGMGAAGFLALMLMERDGEKVAANVQRFDEPEGVTLPQRSPELLLGLVIWATLPAKAKERVVSTLRGMVYCEKADPAAVALYNALLNKGGVNMAMHAPNFGSAAALPLAAVLTAIPSFPRPVIERLVACLIDHLDEREAPAEDTEDDDPMEDGHDAESADEPRQWRP